MGFLRRVLEPFAPVWQWLKRYHLDKVVITGGSMAVFIWAFTLFFGFWLSALFTFLLFIHEMGHVVALRWRGLSSSSPIFIPFLGAVVILRNQPRDADEEALVGYGGPFFGSLAAFATYGIWMAMPSHPRTLLLGGMIATMLNLYNMAPIPPLDGGRVTRGFGGWFKYLGFIFIAIFAFAFQSPSIPLLTMIVLVMGGGMVAKHRLIFGVFCQLLMVAMIALRIGFQGTLLSAWPLVLIATYLNVMIYWSYRKDRKLKQFREERVNYYSNLRPELRDEMIASLPQEAGEPDPFTGTQKMKWLLLYTGLLAALILFMYLQWVEIQLLLNS